MGEQKSDVLQHARSDGAKDTGNEGPLHGYGIARRIEQVSGNSLTLNQGTIYPALLRLEQRGWIRSEWGNRRLIAARSFILSTESAERRSRRRRRTGSEFLQRWPEF